MRLNESGDEEVIELRVSFWMRVIRNEGRIWRGVVIEFIDVIGVYR